MGGGIFHFILFLFIFLLVVIAGENVGCYTTVVYLVQRFADFVLLRNWKCTHNLRGRIVQRSITNATLKRGERARHMDGTAKAAWTALTGRCSSWQLMSKVIRFLCLCFVVGDTY